jgi:hypothetical protein
MQIHTATNPMIQLRNVIFRTPTDSSRIFWVVSVPVALILFFLFFRPIKLIKDQWKKYQERHEENPVPPYLRRGGLQVERPEHGVAAKRIATAFRFSKSRPDSAVTSTPNV